MHDDRHWQELRQQFAVLIKEQSRITGRMRAFLAQADILSAELSHFEQSLGALQTRLNEIPTTTETNSFAVPPDISEAQSVAPTNPVEPETPLQTAVPTSEPLPAPTKRSTPLHLRNLEPDTKNGLNFEVDLGIKWLSRIGIIALLIGIAMGISYTFPSFSNPFKILTGFIISAVLYGAGHYLYKQTAILGRILQGGGISVGYLSLFAIFFIPGVQLLQAPEFGLVSLFCYVGLTMFLAHRLNSQTVALLSLAFGYYTSFSAVSPEIAFISTGMLSLATVGLTKLHPDWRIISKANLLGAILTYTIWNFRTSQYGNSAGKAYLIYTFLLFHIVSLLRARTGDFILNQLNTFGFYILYQCTQPAIAGTGIFEGMIAILQLGSLIALKAQDKEQDNAALDYGLLLTGLLFAGLGTVRFFDGKMVSCILAAGALSLGSLSSHSRYRTALVSATYIFLLLAYLLMVPVWGSLTNVSLMISAAWLCLVSLLLEAVPFRNQEGIFRACFLLIPAQWLALSAIMTVATSEWRTITIFSMGFIDLALGFILQRKLYRILGLSWIFLIGGVSLLSDMAFLSTGYKILVFILLGVGLLAGSYFYSLLAKRLLVEQTAGNVQDKLKGQFFPNE